jgi:uncharacterized protein (DUF1697 family)
MTATRYIALLRGINVGGHKKIKMADLREMFTALGFTSVKTALASGNIAWDAAGADPDVMQAAIAQGIEDTFGFSVSVIVFPRAQVEALVDRAPFAGLEVTKETRLYVTFLPVPAPTTLDLPYRTATGDFTILSASDTEVCSVLTITHTRSVDAMQVLETEFGKNITTRNWNTVLKLAAL